MATGCTAPAAWRAALEHHPALALARPCIETHPLLVDAVGGPATVGRVWHGRDLGESAWMTVAVSNGALAKVVGIDAQEHDDGWRFRSVDLEGAALEACGGCFPLASGMPSDTQHRPGEVHVVVAVSDIALGEVVQRRQVKWEPRVESELPPGALTDLSAALCQPAARATRAGDPLAAP
ncbi:MAG: Flp pilus assembly protein CpaB [Myxococcota bacterium]|jgi:Flp pilus assembly protein CpaB